MRFRLLCGDYCHFWRHSVTVARYCMSIFWLRFVLLNLPSTHCFRFWNLTIFQMYSLQVYVVHRGRNLNSGYIWNITETKQFHRNKTLFCVCFVSVLFQFHFRCNHWLMYHGVGVVQSAYIATYLRHGKFFVHGLILLSRVRKKNILWCGGIIVVWW